MQIELHKTIAAKPQAVFRTIADIVNWPQIIRSVAAVELLTHGRVRVGTRVRLHRIIYGHQMIEELEVETFERDRRQVAQRLRLSLWVYFTISGRSMTSAATLGHIAFGYPSLTARHCVFCTQSRRWLVTGI